LKRKKKKSLNEKPKGNIKLEMKIEGIGKPWITLHEKDKCWVGTLSRAEECNRYFLG